MRQHARNSNFSLLPLKFLMSECRYLNMRCIARGRDASCDKGNLKLFSSSLQVAFFNFGW